MATLTLLIASTASLQAVRQPLQSTAARSIGFDPNVSPEQKDENGNVPSFAAPGVGITKNADGTFSAASGMTAQLLDADGNSVKAYDSLADAIAAAALARPSDCWRTRPRM